MEQPTEARRTIGVAGAVVTLVGFVVGISIFILPGELAATAGPGVVISYALAAVLALFSCVVAAQLGSAVPVSGASFVIVERTISRFAGFIMVWIFVGAVSVSVALLAYGFPASALLLRPALSPRATAFALVLGMGGLNLLGARASVRAQAVMVAVFMCALGVFCSAALSQIDAALLQPFLPNGLDPVFAAAIPAYFSFAGFAMLIELGGEIRHPQQTIPRALFISFGIVVAIYAAVSLAIVGVVPWRELGDTAAPVGRAAALVLPGWAVQFVTLSALAAAATSVNAMFLGYSRDILALARARLLPEPFARVSAKHGEPIYGVVFIVVVALGAVLVGGTIAEFATFIVFGLMVNQVLQAVAVSRLAEAAPVGFRLGKRARRFFAAGLGMTSLVFLVRGIVDNPRTAAMALAYLVVGLALYRWF